MTERHARRRRDWWPAPAKLNLCLHILGRRSDGYHELQTVFQLLDWCDELAFEPPQAPGVIERVEGPAGIDPKTDLAVRAAYALRAAALARGHPRAAELGARLRLHKRIPIGAGLGGGSSDAATALRALNHYWDLGFDLAELTAIGLRLGADVPVFLGGRSAWAEGVGERLMPIDLPQRWFLILHPGVAVRTAEVFQDPELTRNSPLMTIRGFFESGGRNDCEPLVRARYPAVAAALDWLTRHAPARLTGTGSCLFAAFASAAQAERIAARVPDDHGWRAWVVQGLAVSPLEEAHRWGVAKW